MNQAAFVVLEGIDGAGTTTQAKLLTEALRARRVAAVETHEPSDGPVGMLLRQMLRRRIVPPAGTEAIGWQQLALLFAADRLDHLEAEVLPRLAEGVCVVCDRYDYSSIAYQSAGVSDAEAIPWLRAVNRHARRPDLTLVLDVAPDVARARRLARAQAREIFDDDPLQGHLSGFYAEIERHFPHDPIVHVRGEGEPSAVAAEILRHVLALRGRRS